MIKYEDLIEQLTLFRVEVIEALAEIQAEVEALQGGGIPLTDDFRSKVDKIRARYAVRLPPLHERQRE
jgi:hypothetical protein